MPRFIGGTGNASAQLLILGEAPGYHEDQAGEPFVGPSGEMLNDLLQEAGAHRSHCYVTNVVKYRPPDNKLARLHEIDIDIERDCLPILANEINAINPNCILALGDTALRYTTGITGITKWRGSILQTLDKKRKVVGTLHPANLLPGSPSGTPYAARAYITLDIRRAIEESKTDRYDIPRRNLRVLRSSMEVYRFLAICKQRGRVAVDIEAAKSIPICIAFAYDRFNAASIPLLDVKSSKNLNGIPPHELIDIIKQIAAFCADPSIEIIGQNFKYDQERLLHTWQIECANVYADTSILAHTINPEFPKSLEFNTSIYTREPFYKNVTKTLDEQWNKYSRDKIFIYNARDTAVDYEVFEEQIKDAESSGLIDFFFKQAMPMHNFYRKMEERGFKVNEEKRINLLHKYLKLEREVKDELKDLCGHPVNYNSPPQMKDLVFNQLKFKVGKSKKGEFSTGEDVLVMNLANHTSGETDPKHRILSLCLKGRRITKTIGTYIIAKPDYDGRMRTVFRIAVTEEGTAGGTETGRSSTSVLKPPVRPEQLGMAFQTLTKHGDIGPDIRTILEPDDGYVLLGADFSQAEARGAANYAEDDETLKKFDTIDIHCEMASIAFGTQITDKKDGRRQVGKTLRYLAQYDGQKRRLMLTLHGDAHRYGIKIPNVSEWKCGQFLEAYHKTNPRTKQVFHADVQRALNTNERTLINPFGRRRTFYDRYGDGMFREAYAFICSSMVIDALRGAMLRIENRKPGTQWILEAHDALLLQCRENEVEEYTKIIREEMTVPINFDKCSLRRKELTIPCEVEKGSNYGEMVKIK